MEPAVGLFSTDPPARGVIDLSSVPRQSSGRVPLSILDVVSVSTTVAAGIEASMEAIRIAERTGYTRYWFAEHHNMRSIASSATAVLIGQAAAATERIRVGSGGIMLPNHAPLAVAEAFGTLAQIFPGRIDLGLGRAPGTDQMTAQALARSAADPQSFAQNIYDLQGWFGPDGAAHSTRIISAPSAGTDVPIWVLGSTVAGASIAGQLGLPFAIASHFAPDQVDEAIAVYRQTFNPKAVTARLEKPYLLVGVNVMACDDAAEARRQFTSVEQSFAGIRRGLDGPLSAPVDDVEKVVSPADLAMARGMLAITALGTAEEVVAQLDRLVERTGADELITITRTWDPAVWLRSLELTAQAWLG